MASIGTRLLQPGRTIFAIGIFGLGIVCIIVGDFIVGRPPAWPEGIAVNPALAYISAAILITAAVAILLGKKAGLASLVIAALIFFLSILRIVPHFMNDWLNGLKAMALFGGALVVACSSYQHGETMPGGVRMSGSIRKGMILAGSVLLAAFFIGAGYAHFKFADFIINGFIPDYIPFHSFWAYFCGICLIAGGIGLLTPFRKTAALMSGIMVLGWFVLLHVPRFLSNMQDASDRMGLVESFTFGGIFFTLAGMHTKND